MTPTEATVSLDLSEYEASVITGALVEFGERWPEEAHTAGYLRERIRKQLPSEWTEGDDLTADDDAARDAALVDGQQWDNLPEQAKQRYRRVAAEYLKPNTD